LKFKTDEIKMEGSFAMKLPFSLHLSKKERPS